MEFMRKNKLCSLCLKANHIAKNCQSTRSCIVEKCGWRHHTLLHAKQKEQFSDVNDVHVHTQS